MRSPWHHMLGAALVVALVGWSVVVAAAASAADSAEVVPRGKMTLAWHVNIAPRWLDPQEHDGTATPDNFITAIHDALIKNQGSVLYDHPALAERFEFARDATSATFWLRPGVKFHHGELVTPEDVKFTYENYRGAKADLLKGQTERIEIIDDRTIRFVFKGPFLDFPLIFGTANASGDGWIVPAKYYQQVGPDGFKQKPIGAGPYKLVRQEAGMKLELVAFEDYYRPVHVQRFIIVSVPEGTTRVAMPERGEADIIYVVPGELIGRVKGTPNVMLAPVLSASWWLEFPGLQDPKNPYVVPVFRHAAVQAIGPRIAAERWQDVFQTMTTGYAYPWEDVKLRDK
jgi:peptide/nickel transport system substrate-binding protein